MPARPIALHASSSPPPPAFVPVTPTACPHHSFRASPLYSPSPTPAHSRIAIRPSRRRTFFMSSTPSHPPKPPVTPSPVPPPPSPRVPPDTPNLSNSASVNQPRPLATAALPNRWAVVIAASVIHALHAACVYMGPTTLMSPMRHSLNLTVAQITQPLTAFRIMQAVFLVPAGYVLDALGPQFCLRVSITAAAVMAPLLPIVTTLPQLIVLQSLFGLTKLFGGLSALLLITSQAFPDGKRMGTATSILLSGYSFAGFLAPTFIGALADTAGWRFAFSILSAIFIVVALPLTFVFLRDREPARQRQSPSAMIAQIWQRITTATTELVKGNADSRISSDNSVFSSSDAPRSTAGGATDAQTQRSSNGKPASTPVTPPLSSSASASATKSQASGIFTAPYLLIAVAVTAFSFSMHIIFDHLLVFLGEDFGLPFQTATKYMSALNLVALFSKLGVGPIADRYNKSLLITLFASVAAFASTLLLDFSGLAFSVTSNPIKVMAFVILYSFGYASVFSLTTSALPELGREKLGIRSNWNLMLLFGSGSLGSYIAAMLRSEMGSYKWPFMLNASAWVFVAMAGLAKFFLYDRVQEKQHVPTAEGKVNTE